MSSAETKAVRMVACTADLKNQNINIIIIIYYLLFYIILHFWGTRTCIAEQRPTVPQEAVSSFISATSVNRVVNLVLKIMNQTVLPGALRASLHEP
jgi:hypothetical protein